MQPTLCLLIAACALAGDDPRPVSFKADVAPILVRQCLGCHNDEKAQGGLKMTTFSLLKRGGKTAGADILTPGDPVSSQLIESLRPDASPRMPFKRPPLTDAQVATLERWVKEGAKFDGESERDTRIASLVDPLANLRKVAVKVPTSDPVTTVAFSPDGKSIVAAIGRRVALIEIATSRTVATFDDHPGPLTFVAFTPDGSRLVAAGGRPGQFGAVTIWDLASKSRRHDIRGHADSILSAALSPDGKTLATASYDRLVKLWDLEAGKEIRTLKEHTDAVHAVAFSSDGKSLATGSADRTVKVWDVVSGKRRVSVSDSLAEVYAVAFSPDAQEVLGAGADRSIRAWTLTGDSGSLAHSSFAHEAAVLRLAVSADGKTLVSSGEDRAVKRWDLATLKPLATFAGQSDWPMGLTLSADGSRLAVGRYDGSIALLDATTGQVVSTLREPPHAAAPKRELVRNASLNPPNPRGGVRGKTIRLSLTGNGVGDATAVVFPEAGLSGKVLPREKPDPNALDVELNIAADCRVGVHRLLVQTPLGVPASQPFTVTDLPEVAESEPNDEAGTAKSVTLPATLVGTIDRPGDVDVFRFDARANQDVVFELLARPLGSSLTGTLTVVGPEGRVLGETHESDVLPDPLLVFHAPSDGHFALRVCDADFGGSGAHFYRIRVGILPSVRDVFPRAIRPGDSRMFVLRGTNLGESQTTQTMTDLAKRPVDANAVLPAMIGIPGPDLGDVPSASVQKIVVADGSQDIEGDDPIDAPEKAQRIANPGGVSGHIEAPGNVDFYRFSARKGRPLIVEVYGRRLGSPIDSAIEILDVKGQPIPRAVLRPVEETNVAFRDHASLGRSMRLTQWNDFYENDFVLIGRELSKIDELPRNPDDDAVHWGTGTARGGGGERLGFLDTTPEHHPQGQPIYKVEIHPPGTTFPRGGTPPVTLFHRNDDGGPGHGKDSKITFDPPADGDYLVRVEDVRTMGGDRFVYHLLVREPRPDFRISLSQENPNIPRGGAAIVQVNAARIDGFDDPIEIAVEGLPPGIKAEPSRIERGMYAASLLLTADESAAPFSPPTWSVTGISGNLRRVVDPGGPTSGFLTVTSEPNLKIGFRPEVVTIHPGERVEMTLTVDRGAAFAGRVPIDVRNLPRGVRVLNIGLNGVLVTEKQTERSISLYAEPWVEPTRRPFFAVGNCEPAGTEHSSQPILLNVERRAPESTTGARDR